MLEYLLQPDGPDAGQPFRPTPEQLRFVLWWYAIDARGRFAFRYGVLRRMKGWGKDPVGAALCATEFVGPCRFGGMDANGDPVAVAHPAAWVQTAAVAKDQTRNTMTLFPSMLSPALCDEHGIDLGKEIIYAHQGRARIEAVTSSPRALEGGRATFTLKNETHHWLANNDGHDMADVISRNLAKSRDGSARALAITNAHNPGEDSDAEHDWDAHRAIVEGKSRATGLLYDSLEAPADTDLSDRDSLTAGLVAARGDSHWLDVERLADEIWDPRTAPSVARRFYLNQLAAAEDAWLSPQQWEVCGVDGSLADGDAITLGFDGSRTDDSTALVACRMSDGLLTVLAVDEKPDGPQGLGWEVDRTRMHDAVLRAFDLFDVQAFYADVKDWETYVDTWAREYGDDLLVGATTKHAVAWDMRSHQAMFTFAAERFHAAVIDRAVVHDEGRVLHRHIVNCRRRPNRWGVSVGKEHRESPHKIDAAVTAVLAWLARSDVLDSGKTRKRRTGKAAFF